MSEHTLPELKIRDTISLEELQDTLESKVWTSNENEWTHTARTKNKNDKLMNVLILVKLQDISESNGIKWFGHKMRWNEERQIIKCIDFR